MGTMIRLYILIKSLLEEGIELGFFTKDVGLG
jgi:hypothetical protein